MFTPAAPTAPIAATAPPILPAGGTGSNGQLSAILSQLVQIQSKTNAVADDANRLRALEGKCKATGIRPLPALNMQWYYRLSLFDSGGIMHAPNQRKLTALAIQGCKTEGIVDYQFTLSRMKTIMEAAVAASLATYNTTNGWPRVLLY